MIDNSEIPNINKKQTKNITPNPRIRTRGRVEISLVKLPYCLYLKNALCLESFGPGEEEIFASLFPSSSSRNEDPMDGAPGVLKH